MKTKQNIPSLDYSYWIENYHWTLFEATCLLVNIDPRLFSDADKKLRAAPIKEALAQQKPSKNSQNQIKLANEVYKILFDLFLLHTECSVTHCNVPHFLQKGEVLASTILHCVQENNLVIPEPLKSYAASVGALPGEPVGTCKNFDVWFKKDQWTICEAILITRGVDPDLMDEVDWIRFSEYEDLLSRAVAAGGIKTTEKNTHQVGDPKHDNYVDPKKWLTWALVKGIVVPRVRDILNTLKQFQRPLQNMKQTKADKIKGLAPKLLEKYNGNRTSVAKEITQMGVAKLSYARKILEKKGDACRSGRPKKTDNIK